MKHNKSISYSVLLLACIDEMILNKMDVLKECMKELLDHDVKYLIR